AETRDVAMRNPHTAPTREVQRSHLPAAVSGSGDGPLSDSVDEDAETLHSMGGGKFPSPRNVVTPHPAGNVDPLAQTKEASRLDPRSFGGPNPGETSTSEKTRPAVQAMSGPSAPPLFGDRGPGPVPMAAAPAATDAPTHEHQGDGPSPAEPYPSPGPGQGMRPAGQDAYGGAPGQSFEPGGAPMPRGPAGPMGGPEAPRAPGLQPPPGLQTPPGMMGYGHGHLGDDQVPALSGSASKGFFDKSNLILAAVFVISVALGLGATLLLAR
ncbi:MAG: hypothetical protein KJO07_07190, partial [Deltaproteobacteria bacterium]|nr:hypothetical protein [Deltaproteobacteria bacterium]